MYLQFSLYIFIIVYIFILVSPFIKSIRDFINLNVNDNKNSENGFILDIYKTIDNYINGFNVKKSRIYEEYILYILLFGFILSILISVIWGLIIFIGIIITIINLILNKIKKQK